MNAPHPAEVPLAPAPWQLTGSAYIVSVRLPRAVQEAGGFIPEGLALRTRSRVAQVMFVDYADSDVGPYHELLYIPGKLDFGAGRRFLSITRIYVSSQASVVNGRINWGIPKDRCDFDVRYGAARDGRDGGPDGRRDGRGGIDRVALTAADGTRFAELEFEARGPRLPAPGHWVPPRLRTLAQRHEGREFVYTPEARGHFRFARVRSWRFDPKYFPDLAQGEVVRAVQLTDFRMTFPVAQTR